MRKHQRVKENGSADVSAVLSFVVGILAKKFLGVEI